MQSAANVLRVFVVAGSTQMATCGCLNVGVVGSDLGSSLVCIALSFGVQVVALILISRGAEAIRKGRKRGLGVAACALTLVLALLNLTLSCVAVQVELRREPFVVVASLGMALVVGVIGLIGAIRGLAILNKPEVLHYYERP
jgi:hypothetical protein